MDKDILKGIKISFGFVLFLVTILSLSYAGYHGANQVISGTFLGNYIFQNNITFQNDVNFSDANIIGLSVGGIPSGFVGTFPMSTCPSGWLETNGSEISRVTYSTLYSQIGLLYGNTTSTTFKIPDYRGYFLRGWDNGAGNDPDAATRTDSGDGTIGDNVGTKQTSTYESHLHSVDPPSTSTTSAGSHAHSTGGGTGSHTVVSSAAVRNIGMYYGGATGSAGAHTHSVNIGAFNSASSGGSETRPININVLYCIKE